MCRFKYGSFKAILTIVSFHFRLDKSPYYTSNKGKVRKPNERVILIKQDG